MSGVSRAARTEIWQLFLQPRSESSTGNIFEITNGLRVQIQRTSGSAGYRCVTIQSKTAVDTTEQSTTFGMNGNRTFEILIAKDVQKIPVTLVGDKSKTIEWMAPFARLPINFAARGMKCTILIDEEKEESDIRDFAPPKEQKEVSGPKEGKKNDEAVPSAASNSSSSMGAVSTNAKGSDTGSESLKSSASSAN